jgi:glycine/D-amino acid oxidase-like deaminating enzyme
VILNRGHWVLPTAPGEARVGATYVRVDSDPNAAREELERSAHDLLAGRPFTVAARETGVRVTAPDRRPLAGWDSQAPRLGVINGLGSKGALLAPWLAREWVAHLTARAPFEAGVQPGRFARRNPAAERSGP